MKKQLLTAALALASFAQAQNINVQGFTKLNLNLLKTPAAETVVPTADGGYFYATGLKLTKYKADNTEDWNTSLSGTSRVGYIHNINAVCDDGQGGAIITGTVCGTLSAGNDSITPFYTASGSGFYSGDAFIARVSASGKVWWHRMGEYDQTSPGTDQGLAVQVVGDKVYWLAHVTGRNFRFGSNNYPLNQYSTNVSVLAQFGMDGTSNWIVATKGGGSIPKYLVAQNNLVAIAGFNAGSSTAIDFGNGKTLKYTTGSHFVTKFNTAGQAQWAVIYDNDNNATNQYGFTADPDGDLYACGMASSFTSSYGIKPGQGYLVKVNGADGTHAWTRLLSKVAGASNVLHGPLLGVKCLDGKLYVCGNTNGNLHLQSSGTDSVEMKLSSNLLAAEHFVAQYDKSGTLTASLKANGGAVGGTMEYLVQAGNQLIGVGVFSTNLTFGSHTMPSTGGNVGAYFVGFYSFTPAGGSNGLTNNSLTQTLAVYPNPTNHMLTINEVFSKPVEAAIYGIDGKLMMRANLEPNALNALDLSTLKAGIYYLQAIEHNTVFTQKIMKQ